MPISDENTQTIQSVIRESADAFHIRATLSDGSQTQVPATLQMAEYGFRPAVSFGKVSSKEQQELFDSVVSTASAAGVDLGLTGNPAVTRLLIQMGIGIDNPNFLVRTFIQMHEQLGLRDYLENIYRPTDDIKTWRANNPGDGKRDLTDNERRAMSEPAITWRFFNQLFGKDPMLYTETQHISAPDAIKPVSRENVQAGDMVVFNDAESELPTHLGLIDEVVAEAAGAKRINFWHVWDTRDFDSGLRRDRVRVVKGELTDWTHTGLNDRDRYAGHEFVRTIGLDSLPQVEPVVEGTTK